MGFSVFEFVYGLFVGFGIVVFMLIRKSVIGINLEKHYESMAEDMVYDEFGIDGNEVKIEKRRTISKENMRFERSRKRFMKSLKARRIRKRKTRGVKRVA